MPVEYNKRIQLGSLDRTFFDQLADQYSMMIGVADVCGARQCKANLPITISSAGNPFVKFTNPVDQWKQPWELVINPTLATDVG